MKPWRSKKYLAWIRKQECSVCCMSACEYHPMEAHHVRTGWNCGGSQKPADYFAIPVHQEDCHYKCGNYAVSIEEQLVDVTRMIDRAVREGIIEIKVK